MYKKKPLWLKIKNWLKEVLFDPYDRFIVFKWIHRVKYAIRWKLIHPRNKICVKTLPNGYHDIVEVMLHANFAMLVDFVENEILYRNDKFEDILLNEAEERKMYESYVKDGCWTQKDADAAIECIVDQNNRNKKIHELYLWWKHIRPTRKFPNPSPEVENLMNVEFNFEPVEESKDEYGDAKYYKLKGSPKEVKEYFDEYRKQEEVWDKEDDNNLMELIKLRRCLWT
jgi:hypothetical protein